MKSGLPILLLGGVSSVLAATPAEWRTRIIYQVLTDRFARTDGSTSAACDVTNKIYCGGTWQGLINQLPYIHDMGFTAVGASLRRRDGALNQ